MIVEKKTMSGGAMAMKVQYVVVRADLHSAMGWPLGAVIAQACHAATAAMHRFHQHVDTQHYLTALTSMHKVVLRIEDEATLKSLAQRLESAGVDHHVWLEQPEAIPTAIATRPYDKAEIKKYFTGLKLYS